MIKQNNKRKLHSSIRHPVVPTQQDFEYDSFYYNSEEDTREVLSEVLFHEGSKALHGFGYNLSSGYEDERVSKFW